jgi:hypothetical protein
MVFAGGVLILGQHLTRGNLIEAAALLASVLLGAVLVRRSNRKVADLDGLGSLVKKKKGKGKVRMDA